MITRGFLAGFTERVRAARTRMLCRQPFFGIIMMGLRLGIDESLDTAATDGERIIFGPEFAGRLSDEELDFVIMHEIMHVALDHVSRGCRRLQMVFNVACDIVINSTIMQSMGVKEFVIDGVVPMHLAPDGREGHLFTAEEVYRMLIQGGFDDESLPDGYSSFDIHDLWGKLSEAKKAELRGMIEEAAETVRMTCGNLPGCIERAIGQRRKGRLDWRRILHEFVQEDMMDYSFTRPDRRYSEEFIMPGFVAEDGSVKNILFMIDTSGSMSSEEITEAFSEICSAIDQFGGRLSGQLGFFDAAVTPPVPFDTTEDVMKITPVGGGGTSVSIVFDYIEEHMSSDPPASVVILTDGIVDIPKEDCSKGIPVLWLFTYPVELPGWGVSAYIGEAAN